MGKDYTCMHKPQQDACVLDPSSIPRGASKRRYRKQAENGKRFLFNSYPYIYILYFHFSLLLLRKDIHMTMLKMQNRMQSPLSVPGEKKYVETKRKLRNYKWRKLDGSGSYVREFIQLCKYIARKLRTPSPPLPPPPQNKDKNLRSNVRMRWKINDLNMRQRVEERRNNMNFYSSLLRKSTVFSGHVRHLVPTHTRA
jgi:hypothetical protein